MSDEKLISNLEALNMKCEVAYFKSKIHGRDAFLGSSAYGEYMHARRSACAALNKANEIIASTSSVQ